MHTVKLLLTALAVMLLSTSAVAQNMKPNGDNRELLKMGLYPPDIIMRQQERLGITTEQRKTIAGLVRDFQGEVTELQWSMPAEQQRLRSSLNESSIDSAAALALAAKVMAMESEFKLAHFELLIAIKNELSAPQIDQLNNAIKRRLGDNR